MMGHNVEVRGCAPVKGKQMCRLCDDGGEHGYEPASAQSRGAEGGTNSNGGLAAISERAAFENWFNTECSLPDINTIYGTVAWVAWKARAKAANVEVSGRPHLDTIKEK
jgi:hypothetical protein